MARWNLQYLLVLVLPSLSRAMPKDEDWLKEPPQTTNTYYFSQDGGVQDSPKTSYTNIAMHPAATSATTSTKTPCDSSQPVDDHWTLSAAQPNPYETGESSEQTHLYPAFNHSSYSREPSDSYGSQSNYTSLSAIFEPSSPSLENSCPPPSTVTDTVTVTVNAEASAAASAFAEAPQITPTKTVTVTARVCNNLPPNSRAGGDYGLATYGNGLTEGSPYVTSEGEGLPNPTGGEAYPTQGGQGVVEPFPTVDTDGGEAYSAGGGNVLPTGGGQGYPTGGEGFSTGGGGFATGEGGYPTMGGEAYPTNTGEVYASGRGGPAYTTPCDVGNNCKSQIAGSGSYGYGVGFPTASATNDGGNWQATGVQVPPFPTIGESYGQPSVNLPQSAMQSGLCAPCSEPGYNSAPYPAGTTSTGTSGGQSYEAPSYSMPSSNSSSRGQSHNTTAVLSNSFPGYGAPYPTTETKNPKFSCPCGMIVGPPPTSEYMSPFETDGSLPPQDSGYHAGSGGLEYPASHPFSALSTNYPAGSAFPQATDSPSNSSISCDNSETINTTVIQDFSSLSNNKPIPNPLDALIYSSFTPSRSNRTGSSHSIFAPASADSPSIDIYRSRDETPASQNARPHFLSFTLRTITLACDVSPCQVGLAGWKGISLNNSFDQNASRLPHMTIDVPGWWTMAQLDGTWRGLMGVKLEAQGGAEGGSGGGEGAGLRIMGLRYEVESEGCWRRGVEW